MNTETGSMYYGSIEIEQAKFRGEPVVSVSEKVAELMEMAHRELNRKQRRQAGLRRGFQKPRV